MECPFADTQEWGNFGARLVECLFADGTVLLAESERMLQRFVDDFARVCKRRKLKVSVGKSKVMAFQRVKDGIRSF